MPAIAQTIDLNCDMAEYPAFAESGIQDALLQSVSSINVACGAHAGSPALMERTIRSALRHGVAIGAHPGFPDRQSFGRLLLEMSPANLAASLEAQLSLAIEIATRCETSLSHVKPHGALYNAAAQRPGLARIIAESTGRQLPGIPMVVLAGAPTTSIFTGAGFPVIPEAFTDRRYEADGSLRPRDLPGALITSPAEAAAQALSMVLDGVCLAFSGQPVPIAARTLCIHSDTPDAPAIAAAVRSALESHGIAVSACSSIGSA